MYSASLSDIRDLFTLEDYAQIVEKVALIAEEVPMIAEDDFGGTYNYGLEGFPDERPVPRATEWLGVRPKRDEH